VACGFKGAVSLSYSVPGLERDSLLFHKDNHLKLRLRSSKKLNTTHTPVFANFLIGALFYISVVTCNERRGIGVPSDPMRANHTPAPWVCAMIGGVGWGRGRGMGFSCHVILGAMPVDPVLL
jgi:hypothetical protein